MRAASIGSGNRRARRGIARGPCLGATVREPAWRALGWPRSKPCPSSSHRAAAERLPSRHDARVVRAGRHSLLLLLIPESTERAAVGMIGETASITKTVFRTIPREEASGPRSGRERAIPVYRKWVPVRRQLGWRSLLVGDAAAQVKVSTVGGIVTDFRGALGVAKLSCKMARARSLVLCAKNSVRTG